MARYIDADKLVETIERYVEPYKTWDCTKFDVAMEAVDDTPAADVVEVRHAIWIDNHNGTFTCSVCGGRASKMAWCGRCGAKMDGGEKDG